jgi:threonine/homoserine/homoserine lactone efflux protein
MDRLDRVHAVFDPGRLAAFAVAAFVIIVVPGPGVLFIVSRGVSLGRRAALATVIGHLGGQVVQFLAVAVGVGAIVERSIAVFTVLKLAGAAYLVWLGIQAIRHRHALASALGTAHTRLPLRRVARDGFIVGVTNPKGFALFASVLPQFIDPGVGHVPLQTGLLGLIFCIIALASDSTWAFVAGTARAWFARSPRRLAAVRGTGGLITIGLGVRLAATGRRD